ncbi:MAG: hypothetical protein KJ811_02855, partial [Candidatus Margulisbacteria bacterium]|nr:hypothetical protein [Candidatus Margulisiibacteriota bacterium]
FGEGGVVLDQGASGGTNNIYGYDIKVNSEGNYFVAGQTFSGLGAEDVAVWSFLPDGTRDMSFGTNGLVITHGFGGGFQENAWDMVLNSADQIIIAGRTQDSSLQYDMLICRYTPEGVLDTTFGIDGFQTHNNAAGAD